jgi:hypothetical protein
MKHISNPRYGPFLLTVLILTAATLNVSMVHAAGMAVTWTGAAKDGKWETAGNWVFGNVPGANDLVSISGPVTVSLSSPVTIAGLLLQAPAVLNCNAACSLSSGISNYGTVNNYGMITDLLGGTIENFGTINNSGAIMSNHISTNSGTITNNYGGSITFGGGNQNSGIITNNCGGTMSGTVSGKTVNTIKC